MNGLVQPDFAGAYIREEQQIDFADRVDSVMTEFYASGVMFGNRGFYSEDDIDEMFFESSDYNTWRSQMTVATREADIRRLGMTYRIIKKRHRKIAIQEVAEQIARGEL